VIVLLPPSEGKTAPSSGPPLDLGALSFPELTPQRERLLRVLTGLKGRRGLAALGLSPRQAGELDRNAALLEAPTAPAFEVYTGVLYERLGLASVPRERVLIASALWGFLRADDPIPAYRLSMGAKLPRIPNLAAWWRPHLKRVIPAEGLFVDMRSAAYAAAWKPPGMLPVRVFTPEGKVVSHMAKATRGEVARRLLLDPVQTPEEVAALVGGELGPGPVLDVIGQTAAV
jgi:cytoplasmic iron level regulating protein YaaA (DUF328/UPF0246 family)